VISLPGGICQVMSDRLRRVLLLGVVVLAGCVSQHQPTPSASPLRLPTRVAPTSTPTPTPVSALPYYEAGRACQEAGDTECALQSYASAIEIQPDFVEAYIARGGVHLAQDQPKEALADADAALAVDPSSAPAHALRGEALRVLGRSYQALEAFDRAVALDPSLEEALFRSQWLAAIGAGDKNRLIKLSRKYGEAHPDDSVRHYYRGWAFIAWGNPGVAVHILIDGIEEVPDPPALLWFALGYAYSAHGMWQEAVTCFETALTLVSRGDTSLDLHSDHPVADAFGALGLAYLGANRCADAEKMLEHAIAIGAPADEYAVALEEARLCLAATPTPTPTPFAPP
jgi:tetratricopeptide (TPR) repeat protein